jgi:hypothetical protein
MGNATYEVLRELLDITPDEIKELRKHRII